MAIMSASTTPMMKQYQEAKQACPDAILLFRMGDFYELFGDDAKLAARTLHLALTSRDKGENPIPMAGFPHHQLDSYMGKLIAAGMRVAVCDQVEDPRQAKGLVRRELTRIVSPGTVTDETLLDPRESNYLVAITPDDSKPGAPIGLAWIDLSTGRFVAAAADGQSLGDHLARLAPKECLISEDGSPVVDMADESMMRTRRPDWAFSYKTACQSLSAHFKTASLEGFGFGDSAADVGAIRAAGAIIDYLVETQKDSLSHIDRLVPYRVTSTLEIDQSSRRSLELTRTIREGRREGSLLSVLDQTVTASGSRLMADWLGNPLVDLGPIVARHDAVEELLGQSVLCDSLRDLLRKIYDLPRLLARVATGRAGPRDVAFIGRTLAQLPELKARLSDCRATLLVDLDHRVDLCEDLREKIAAALDDDCPLSPKDGGFIRVGFHGPLDQLRELTTGGKQWIASYQAEQAEQSGIPNLKVGFNRVFGYYLEVTHLHHDRVPENYIRKQTLKNAERYITPELKEYEGKVLTADERSKEVEYELFMKLRDEVAVCRPRIQATAEALAELDVLAALADGARSRGYVRPTMVEEPVLSIEEGRHPVLDCIEPEGTFVPNDTELDPDNSISLITGPNMAGKSTYIRQVALLTLMSQMGSFIPARAATIGLADRIFARVGASDELTRGQSTFMVEMTETARILNTASRRSLVILDEIGRGTSTYDGISLAWAVVEFLCDHLGCRTLFATHYHELTDLERSLDGVGNLNVAVREWEDDVVFLHKIVPGTADKSYGIHVARLAGVPREVIERAKDILADLEEEHHDATGQAKIARAEPKRSEKKAIQLTLFGPEEHPLVDEIRQADLDQMTPVEALLAIKKWQDELSG
jgi:DNA mismatch repair protein MutS